MDADGFVALEDLLTTRAVGTSAKAPKCAMALDFGKEIADRRNSGLNWWNRGRAESGFVGNDAGIGGWARTRRCLVCRRLSRTIGRLGVGSATQPHPRARPSRIQCVRRQMSEPWIATERDAALSVLWLWHL